jgi:hypothetical protein
MVHRASDWNEAISLLPIIMGAYRLKSHVPGQGLVVPCLIVWDGVITQERAQSESVKRRFPIESLSNITNTSKFKI